MAAESEVAAVLERLALLRRQAAVAYDTITGLDVALRSLAEGRATSEQVLRAAALRRGAATRILAEHERAKPALLSPRRRAVREWRARRAALAAELRDAEQAAHGARQTVAAVQREFAAVAASRAEAAAELRRLTAECAAAVELITAAGGTGAARSSPGSAAPRAD